MKQANKLTEERDWYTASKLLGQAVHLEPEDATIQFDYAKIQWELENWSTAVTHFKLAYEKCRIRNKQQYRSYYYHYLTFSWKLIEYDLLVRPIQKCITTIY